MQILSKLLRDNVKGARDKLKQYENHSSQFNSDCVHFAVVPKVFSTNNGLLEVVLALEFNPTILQ